MSNNPLTAEFNQFFIELAANNHKDWFDENRKRYENEIKKPFEEFTANLIGEVNKIHSDINPDPKKCIFRINRDIRFSKDKTPYKLNRSLAIGKDGKKDMSPKGIYVEMGPEHVRVYRGLYQLDKTEVHKVRTHIANNLKEFKSIYTNSGFKKFYGALRGEKAKRLSKEHKEAAEKEDYMYNKHWYFFSQMDADQVTNPKLIAELIKRYKAGEEAAQFLLKALH